MMEGLIQARNRYSGGLKFPQAIDQPIKFPCSMCVQENGTVWICTGSLTWESSTTAALTVFLTGPSSVHTLTVLPKNFLPVRCLQRKMELVMTPSVPCDLLFVIQLL